MERQPDEKIINGGEDMDKNCGEFFLNWTDAFQAGVEAAGGKGWNLGRLERYGFNVPAGGCLASKAYRSFIEGNNLIEDIGKISRSVTTGNIGDKKIEQKLFLLREKIKAGRIPSNVRDDLEEKLRAAGILGKPVAVRSSATAEDSGKASFAGVHESFLNVRGFGNILSAVKGCYVSLWTPRAVAYRRKMDVKDDEVIPAVVIMEMVEAEAAGVGFTCDPGTGQEFILVISANYGLGESVVGGAVEPDEYRMNLAFEITQKRIGRKEGKTIAKKDGGTEFVQSAGSAAGQVLSDENISRLGMLIQRVFDSLGGSERHQDVEWVFNGKDFEIVQARPVTALPRYTFDEIKNQPDIWSNAQARDTAPMVMSTLNWSWYKLSEKFRENTTDVLDCEIPPGLRYIRLYQGRLYLNMSMQQWIFYDNLGITPRQLNEAMGGHQPEIEINEKKPYRGIKGIKRLGRLVKLIPRGLKTIKGAQKSFDRVNSYTGGGC